MWFVLRDYFILFMIYSFIGWIVEIINFIIVSRKIVDRGFLIGPYLPIYGFGSIAIIIFLSKYSDDLITLFCMCTIICSVLEYFTSYIMEKIFHARWWDYSDYKFNIEGRICLGNAVLFGIGGCIVVYLINPFLLYLLSIIPSTILSIVTIILFLVLIIDFFISFNVIFTFRNFTNNVKKDSTSEINKLVKKMIASKSLLGKRLMGAFPDFKLSIKDLKIKKIVFPIVKKK